MKNSVAFSRNNNLWLLLFLMPCCLIAGDQPRNLVKNGGFEKGKNGNLQGWAGVDGLTAIWSQDGKDGRCVAFDTSVQQSDKKSMQTAGGKAPATRSTGGQYDTVGAHEGCWVFSSPIDLKPGDKYFILEADVWSSVAGGEALIFLRGFQLITEETAGKNNSFFQTPFPGGPAYSEQFGPESQRRDSKAGDYLMVHRGTMHCKITASNQWLHFKQGFNLTKNPSFKKINRLWLKPYAYWPLGIYKFDNIVFRRATLEEINSANGK